MEKEKNNLQEQKAPLKNHDNAFVQVGHNGEPVIPGQPDEKKEEKLPERTANDKR